jgi:2-oxoisovalerate dehydrogenase E1 component
VEPLLASQMPANTRPNKDLLLWIYRIMLTSRFVDSKERSLGEQGHISYHVSSAGPEAIQAAAAALLRPGDDWFYPYYRDRTLALGLGVAAKDIFLQGMTKGADTSFQGRHMPFRFGSKELKIVSRSSVNGAQFLQAVGTAGAVVVARDHGEPSLSPSVQADEIVFVSGGEESMSQIAFYEAVTAATLRRLPVLFLSRTTVTRSRMRV